jgi:ECF transporter S component (folate family)
MKTKQLAINAMLAAMCAVLGYVSLDLGNFKFTFESFPIIIAAFLFGPVHGMIVAFVGTFIYQILKWGLMSTTILWVLPYVIFALFLGLLYKENMPKKNFFALMIAGGILLTLLNTLSIYIDSKVWDYYTFAYVFGSFFVRLIVSVIKSVVFALIVPGIIKAVKPYAA